MARMLAFMYSMLMAVLFLRGCCFKGFYRPGRSAISQSTSTSASSSRWRSLVAGIGQINRLLLEQITQLIEVMLVGRGGDEAVGQATLGIDTNVGLHAKVPLIAFGLMHLRIALLLSDPGRAGCLNDGGIHPKCLGSS